MRILFEMRPAFDGYAGIPQETRLLFNGLLELSGVEAHGMLQHSGHALARGVSMQTPPWRKLLSRDQIVDRLSRVIISIKNNSPNASRAASAMAMRALFGRAENLSRFDARLFPDFIWRNLFDKTLETDRIERVVHTDYRILRPSWTSMHRFAAMTRTFGKAVFPILDTRGYDFFIAETPYPARTSRGTRLIVRYHDAIPLLMPHTISDRRRHQATHYLSLKHNVRHGAAFACVSEATRLDLLSMFPQLENRSTTIHNMLPEGFFAEEASPSVINEILQARRESLKSDEGRKEYRSPAHHRGGSVPPKYLLMVSTIEPRKNHTLMIDAWESLRMTTHPDLKLVLVGNLGWDYEPILKRITPWQRRGAILRLENIPLRELRLLYRYAQATVCPSVAEGFDFSGVEAMRCEGLVVASDIPVHREIYGNAARYFNPYSPMDLTQTIKHVLASQRTNENTAYRDRGTAVSSQYLPAAILPKWSNFLNDLHHAS